jgi:hypothetical protein
MKRFGFGGLAAFAVSTAALASAAMAQTAPGPVGDVSQLTGPPGSVLVVRGNVTYTLQAGDRLFPGDKVFTRSNGGVSLTFVSCPPLTLVGAQSIDIQSNCAVLPVTLSSQATVGGVEIGAAAGGVGATPLLLVPALLVAGAVAAGEDDPSSP